MGNGSGPGDDRMSAAPTKGEAGAAATDVAAYAAAVATGAPTPGGGSVVAVVAALGAALGEMVCRLTADPVDDGATGRELPDALAQMTELRPRLLALAAADEAAYRGYIAAAALPKATDAERTRRRDALQTALVGAADVPLAVADGCAALATLLEPIARLGNRHAVSDVAVGAWLAEAALRGALLNVRVNARLMRDETRRGAYEARADAVEADGLAAVARALAAATARGA